MTNIFKPDYDHYEGVRRINIYVMRLFFALMVIYIVPMSWGHIISHKGPWDPYNAVAWCTWAAYSTLAILGVIHTLRMLPVMLFMLIYKGLWLIIVAYPLWSANQLKGSPSEELTNMFIWFFIPAIFFPYKYAFKKYILISKDSKQILRPVSTISEKQK